MPCQFPGCVFPTPTNVCFRHASKVYELVTVKPVLIPLPELLEKAQRTFNTWIRNRDKNAGCISCMNGTVQDAGHYLNAGQYSALRFHEFNVNGQCLNCNRQKHGNLESYRIGLVLKIGLKEVKALESMPRLKKWSRKELEEIIEKYK